MRVETPQDWPVKKEAAGSEIDLYHVLNTSERAQTASGHIKLIYTRGTVHAIPSAHHCASTRYTRHQQDDFITAQHGTDDN